MSTLAQMCQRIMDDANVQSYTSVCEQHIRLAINHYKTFPFWFNEATATLSVSTAGVAVPTDFLVDIDLYIQDTDVPVRIEKKSIGEVINYRPQTGGRPTAWTYFGDKLEFNYSADTVYEMRLDYIKELATLSASTDSNAWTTHGENLIVYRAEKTLAAGYFRDPQLAASAAVLERESYISLMRLKDMKAGTGHATPHYP